MRISIIFALGLGWTSLAPRALAQPLAPPKPAASGFKIQVTRYYSGPEPVGRAEIVAHGGRVYMFDSETPEEVVIYDPEGGRIHLLDMARKLTAELPVKKLDESQTALRKAIDGVIGKREAEGGRANRVAAQMSRDLLDPHFTPTFDAALGKLHMANDTTEIDALGMPDAVPARLELVADILGVSWKLAALRDPSSIPPFPRLEALRAMTRERNLRLTELSALYRLAGKPVRLRSTYLLTPSLAGSETKALDRVESMRGDAKRLSFDRYERRAE
ncbi:hypothetical protein EP7_000376 [Isosphaeraceae bacterium EP7]